MIGTRCRSSIKSVLKYRPIYIFAFICITIIYILNGTDLWAESLAEYLRYSLGEGISSSFAGYLTVFPIATGYFYHYVLSWSTISWFDFCACVSYIYTIICVLSIILVLRKRDISEAKIVVILFVLFAMLGHPSVSSLINITHLGYIPVLLYIILCVFDGSFIDEIGNIPKLTFVPLIISMFSKPSLTCLVFILVLMLTKTYKKPLTWIMLAISSGVSAYQLFLFTDGAVGLKIHSIIDLLRFAYIFIQAVGAGIIFAVTYFIEGDVSRIVIALSFILGAFVVGVIIHMLWKRRWYKGIAGAAIIMAAIAVCVIPYISMDCSQSLSVLMKSSISMCFGKHKLQYQLTSSVALISIFLCCIDYVFAIYKNRATTIKKNEELKTCQKGVFFLCILFTMNGMFSGIYSGQWQTVKEIKNSSIRYDVISNYMYPPLPDWDWDNRSSNLGWTKGNTYTKYLNKPNNAGEVFQNKNTAPLPEGISGAIIFLVFSDSKVGKKSPTDYWELFSKEDRAYDFVIGDIVTAKLSRATDYGVRYGIVNFTPELAQRLYEGNYSIHREDSKDEVSSEYLNFIIVWG